MEEVKKQNLKNKNDKDKVEEVVKMFQETLGLIRQKISELEAEIKEEEDLEKITKIKERIEKMSE
ncbi:MAG TPA: hypothetical protein PKH95_00385 [Candidatus Magasanikbacteria bacterium]|nr:hypothetical protein [Candidatus Magasanikbacteria bacterium]